MKVTIVINGMAYEFDDDLDLISWLDSMADNSYNTDKLDGIYME